MPRSLAVIFSRGLPFALLALAACANPQAELGAQAPERLVGLGKAQLLSCAGVPDRSVQAGSDEEMVSYVRTQTILHRDVDWDEFAWGPFQPAILEPEVTEWRTHYRCEATFTLRNGVVTSLSYNPDRDISLCGAIVANCLQPAR